MAPHDDFESAEREAIEGKIELDEVDSDLYRGGSTALVHDLAECPS